MEIRHVLSPKAPRRFPRPVIEFVIRKTVTLPWRENYVGHAKRLAYFAQLRNNGFHADGCRRGKQVTKVPTIKEFTKICKGLLGWCALRTQRAPRPGVGAYRFGVRRRVR